jgi:hypothetical protein
MTKLYKVVQRWVDFIFIHNSWIKQAEKLADFKRYCIEMTVSNWF